MKLKSTPMTSFLVVSTLLGGLPIGPFGNVKAEEPKVDSTQATTDQKAARSEKVTVTGSYIKRIDSEGVAPVDVITRAEISKEGYNNLGEVLRNNGLQSFGGQRDVANKVNTGAFNLRGLGSNKTLVLLNGLPLAKTTDGGASVNINLIPLSAIDRIEIMRDGASALYGSDAMGGVVNIITHKDFAGLEAVAQQTLPDSLRGPETLVGAIYGFNLGKLNVTSSIDGRYNPEVFARDRPWSLLGTVSTVGSYAAIKGNTGGYLPDPNCPASQVVVSGANTFCSFNNILYQSELPESKMASGMSELSYELNPDVKFTGSILGSFSENIYRLAPAPASAGTLVVPNKIIDTWSGLPSGWKTGQSGNGLVLYRFLEAGNRVISYNDVQFNLVLSSKVKVSKSWELTFNLVDTENRRATRNDQGALNLTKVKSMFASGAYNPFGTGAAKGDLSSAYITPYGYNMSRTAGLEARASGDLVDYWAGTLSAAVGATFFHQSFETNIDLDTQLGNVVGGLSAGNILAVRNIGSAFGELSAPLIEKRIELQLAGRYDNFSDFGTTTNPRAGLLVHILPDLILRGGAGTGFAAPALATIYAPNTVGFPIFIDATLCAAQQAKGGTTPACKPAQYQTTVLSNPKLAAETSTSYNVGTMWEPSSNFRIGGEYYYVNNGNAIGVDYNQMAQAELQYGSAFVAQNGYTINRDNTGAITSVVGLTQNSSSIVTSGLEVTTSVAVADLRLTVTHNQVLNYLYSGFPGVAAVDQISWAGKPRWRNTATLTYAFMDGHTAAASAVSVAPQNNTARNADVDAFTSFDFSYTLKTKNWGSLTASVRNILNTTPPYDVTAPSVFNYGLYDPGMRTVQLGYKIAL